MPKNNKTFKSFNEFLKYYFPREYKERQEKELTVEQKASRNVKNVIKEIFKGLKIS